MFSITYIRPHILSFISSAYRIIKHHSIKKGKHFQFAFVFINKDLVSFNVPFLFMRAKPAFPILKYYQSFMFYAPCTNLDVYV